MHHAPFKYIVKKFTKPSNSKKSSMNKTFKQIRFIALLASIVMLLSAVSFACNHWLFHYPGNNYYPESSFRIGITLLLFYIVSYIQTGSSSKCSQIIAHVLAYYGLLALLALLTNAAQYTPFEVIDQSISAAEPLHLLPLVAWTKAHVFFRHILAFIYNSLTYEMVILPIFLALCLKRTYLYEYIILMLLTALIGFGFYYFYPSSGPATIYKPDYFVPCQLATGLKFFQIHHYIQPSTLEGGLIALPSYHVIWAWLCTHSVRYIKPLYYILLPYNALIVLACILLGWHYFLDVLGSILVLSFAHGLCSMYGATAKRSEARRENHSDIQQVGVADNTFS
ncbi:MAG: hypothetical protein CK424_07315 [Legionella sp.]|nr:MAG: hypothetical protein CK424_07315 [Legionella sp.]